MKTTRLLSAVLVFMGLFVLYACGGGGGGDGTTGDLPPTRPTGDIVGTAFDGLIINGNVNVYDFSAGLQGALLGSTKTNGEGKYGLSIQATDKPIVIVVTDGYYIEEATGIQIQLDATKGHKLKAVQYYVSGTPITVSATFLTTVATGLAEYLVRTKGMTVQSAILTANQRVSGWPGFDIQSVTPLDVTDPANATASLTPGHRYGLIPAGISEFTRQIHVAAQEPEHGLWPSIEFVQKAYDDMRADGELDGKGPGGPLSIGNTSIDRDTYRYVLAKAMLQFVVSPRNKTGLGFDKVLPFSNSINTHQGALFGNQPPGANINEASPKIENVTPVSGSYVKGVVAAQASISDDFGIAQTAFYLDGNHLGDAADPGVPVLDMDTKKILNGNHQLKVETTNLLGNKASVTNTVQVANGTISISFPVQTQDVDGSSPYSCGYRVTVSDGAGVGIQTVYRNNDLVATAVPGSQAFNLASQPTTDFYSCFSETVRATDNIGNTSTLTFSWKWHRFNPKGGIGNCYVRPAGDCTIPGF